LKKANPEAIALLMKNMKKVDTSAKKRPWMPNENIAGLIKKQHGAAKQL
jgi:hypothetical protein